MVVHHLPSCIVNFSWETLVVTWCTSVHARVHDHILLCHERVSLVMTLHTSVYILMHKCTSFTMNNHILVFHDCANVLGVISSFQLVNNHTPLLHGHPLWPSLLVMDRCVCPSHKHSPVIKKLLSIRQHAWLYVRLYVTLFLYTFRHVTTMTIFKDSRAYAFVIVFSSYNLSNLPMAHS